MTRVTASDQVMMLLREQLQRMRGGERGRASRTGAAKAEVTDRPLARARGLAAQGELTDEEFRRTLVRAILAEQFCGQADGDPSFQGIADDVFRIVSESEEGRELLDRAAHQLRFPRPPA